MSDRCEPPEELRGQDGWHTMLPKKTGIFGWLKPVVWFWAADEQEWREDPRGFTAWSEGMVAGYEYAPVTPPDVVERLRVDLARLVEAGEAILLHAGIADQHPIDVDEVDRVRERDLRAALAAIKERPAAQHRTRMTDASSHDEVCIDCGATDARGDDRLTKPCPGKKERKSFDALIHCALEAAEAAADQPIATAPRDGSEILAWHGEWNRMVWFTCDYWSGWLYADGLLADADPEPPQPTHWRPLPAPPKETPDAE